MIGISIFSACEDPIVIDRDDASPPQIKGSTSFIDLIDNQGTWISKDSIIETDVDQKSILYFDNSNLLETTNTLVIGASARDNESGIKSISARLKLYFVCNGESCTEVNGAPNVRIIEERSDNLSSTANDSLPPSLTTFLNFKFEDTALNSCPTVSSYCDIHLCPQGDIKFKLEEGIIALEQINGHLTVTSENGANKMTTEEYYVVFKTPCISKDE